MLARHARHSALGWLLGGLAAIVALGTPPASLASPTAHLDMWVTAAVPFDHDAPVVDLHYRHRGDGPPITLHLPAAGQMGAFRGLKLLVDGNECPYAVDVSLDNPAFSTRVVLATGETFTLTVPVTEMFQLPETWATLEFIPLQIHRLRGTVSPLKIERGSAPAGGR